MLLNVYGNQDDSLAGMVIDIHLHQMCNLKKNTKERFNHRKYLLQNFTKFK